MPYGPHTDADRQRMLDALGIGQEPLERSEIQRAGRVAVGDDGYLVDLEARPEIGSDRLPVVRVHGM